ncbi:hypothetical protein EYC84_004425 [Monilinia fructicola]|uniref:Uncharacterized protein n=1 Tax=Monilinia fructicola TaxID=38448 RepID=A0A5M9K4Z5_MONFR|nr:hypothetical protein EYC84_004425 [Monilinia fructicola]
MPFLTNVLIYCIFCSHREISIVSLDQVSKPFSLRSSILTPAIPVLCSPPPKSALFDKPIERSSMPAH